MDQVRTGAYALWRVLIVLFVLVVIVQFFLAGVGVFNPSDNTEPFDPHAAVGFLGGVVGSALLLLLALIAWRDRVVTGGTALLFLLAAFVQPALADYSWAGPFHPVNGLLILGLSIALARRAWGWGTPEAVTTA